MRGGDIDSSEVISMKRYVSALGWALGMLVLILDGKTAMAGASEGIGLCIRTLIPSLFPFFVLSGMLTGSLSGGGLLLAGILGGYPVGARNAANAYRRGLMTRAEARRMVVLCNCAGPSFLFGVAAPVLGGLGGGMMVWICHLVSVGALYLIFPKTKPISCKCSPVTIQTALRDALHSMAGVCGWVVLFRVLLKILDRWVLWLLPGWGRLAFYGILEVSNGCLELGGLPQSTALILAAGFVSFGGICVMLQTAGAAEGIPMGLYFPGKVFQSCVSMLAASLFCPGAVSPAAQTVLLALAAVMAIGLRKSEKRCGNPEAVIV